MERSGQRSETDSSGASSLPFSAKNDSGPSVSIGVGNEHLGEVQSKSIVSSHHARAAVVCPSTPSSSQSDFQDLVLRALLKTTASLIGSSPGLLHFYGEEAQGFPSVKNEENIETTQLNETAYHVAEAKRRRKPDMMRTSAGEESDSQEDFPMPENPTSEQRALRTRRLNRWRGTRARYLTSNRRALKKLPYVIHMDASSKPRDIHRHLWKAAIRGQCSRLDPSMDNINHHPKQVVDSIWHALEREWEFEGFAHKAKDMFEKSATKYMRNWKMQLKYKCQKARKGSKPSDVSDSHWKKIQSIVSKSSKTQGASQSTLAELNENIEVGNHLPSGKRKAGDEEGIDVGNLKRSSVCPPQCRDVLPSKAESVDSEIRSLRRQLQWLESSKKKEAEDLAEVAFNPADGEGTVEKIHGAEPEFMKENVYPLKVSSEKKSTCTSGLQRQSTVVRQERNEGSKVRKSLRGTSNCAAKGSPSVEAAIDEKKAQDMECGDVVCMASIIEGKEEEVGEGVLMGMQGSKYARKVVPNGWCTIKVNSHSVNGGLEACPIPSGWREQLKLKTLKDAVDSIIL